MADIELVVKIPESIWAAIQNGESCGVVAAQAYNAVRNGIPLAEWLKEQEPCKDTISRQAVLSMQYRIDDSATLSTRDVVNVDDIEDLPPVTPHLTPTVLADALMEERIRGELDSDTTFEKDIIRDVKCTLTVSIRDRRPCYCGAELREVWRESEEEE